MEITKDTRVADILKEYGDIADVMEVFGTKRVGRYSIRELELPKQLLSNGQHASTACRWMRSLKSCTKLYYPKGEKQPTNTIKRS